MPPSGEIFARYLFHSREQKGSETVDDFATSLQKLSLACSYNVPARHIEDLVVDRLIAGIQDKDIQKRLIHYDLEELNFSKALEVIRGNEEGRQIKKENLADEVNADIDLSLDSKSNVIGGCKTDVELTEEVKVAILIELMNHKSVIFSTSGNESEKASLWERVFASAKSMGAPFKNALHLREVFSTWKAHALDEQKRSIEFPQDVKVSNSDKFILDLFSQDDYQNVPSVLINQSAQNEEEDSHGDVGDDTAEFTFEDNDFNGSLSDESGNDEDFKPVRKRRPGRPRKSSPNSRTANSCTSVSPEMKVLILKRLLLHKKVIASRGNEKGKKYVWRCLFQTLGSQLSVDSPSSLRTAFRIWKQRSMKKKENPNETISISDRLIYQIFDLNNEMKEIDTDFATDVKEEMGLEEPAEKITSYYVIDQPLRLKIWQEMAKHRDVLGLSQGFKYQKEAAWHEVQTNICQNDPLKDLTIKTLKELLSYWKDQAIKASKEQGGPQTLTQRLVHFIYGLDKNPAFANDDDHTASSMPSNIMYVSKSAKIATLEMLIKEKASEELNLKIIGFLTDQGAKNVSKTNFGYLMKHWRTFGEQWYQGQQNVPSSRCDRLILQFCDASADLKNDSELSLTKDDFSSVMRLVEADPIVISPKVTADHDQFFWKKCLNVVKESNPDCLKRQNDSPEVLKRLYFRWSWKTKTKLAREIQGDIDRIVYEPDEYSSAYRLAFLTLLYHHQEILLLGSPEEKKKLWESVLNKNQDKSQRSWQPLLIFSIWKEELRQRLLNSEESKPEDRMIMELTLGPSFHFSKTAKQCILTLVESVSAVLNQSTVSYTDKLQAWTQIQQKTSHLHHIQDPITFYKAIKRWKLLVLKKNLWQITLNETESKLLSTLPTYSGDVLDAELLMAFEDPAGLPKIYVPDSIKRVIVSKVSNNRNIIFGNEFAEISRIWNDTLESVISDYDVICDHYKSLQKAFFIWTLKAWKKRLLSTGQGGNGSYLNDWESVMLDLAASCKPPGIDAFDFREDSLPDAQEPVEISEKEIVSIAHDLVDFLDLILIDRPFFWSLAWKTAQASWVRCGSPSRLFVAFYSLKAKMNTKMADILSFSKEERSLCQVLGLPILLENKNDGDEDDDKFDDVLEVQNWWESLTENVTDEAKMDILTFLNRHREIVSSRHGGRGDHDKTAVWQKAINIAIGNGIKVENRKLMNKMVKEWRETAQQNREDGTDLAPWEVLILDIFDETTVKTEQMDDPGADNKDWTRSLDHGMSQSASVPNNVKKALAKTLLKHRLLILSNLDQERESGWRKVFRVALSNGAYYDTIESMKSAIEEWKVTAQQKLSKDPASISELDKIIFKIYDVNIGNLDLDTISTPKTPLKIEAPTTRLSVGGKMSILEEMIRNKSGLLGDVNITHHDRFYAWTHVLKVANAVGGNFSSIAQLSTYVDFQLKSPTCQKSQSISSSVNEIDTLVAKIFDINISHLPFQADYHPESPEDQRHPCRLCQQPFERFDELRIHQQMAHGQVTDAAGLGQKCRICGLDIGSEKAAVRVHFRNKHPQEAFGCDYCDTLFVNDDEFYLHAKGHIEYRPLETLEEVSDPCEDQEEASDGDDKPLATQRTARVKPKKRGMYRKRVKIELPPPESDEVPKIVGKKEGGLCPHCGEVLYIFAYFFLFFFA